MIRGFTATTLLLLAVVTPATAQGFLIRLHGGYGIEDGYNAGIGGTVGVNVPFIGGRAFFLGGRVTNHFGKTDDVSGVEAKVLLYGVEFGAQWLARPVVVRMAGGVGVGRATITPPTGTSVSESNLALGPGLIIAVPFGQGGFVGVEAKYWNIKGIENAFAVYATVGFSPLR